MIIVTFPNGDTPPWGSFQPYFEGHCPLEPLLVLDPETGNYVDHGRKMVLGDTFKFYDSRGVEWVAERARVVDGFSIPWFLQNPIVGTPFTGKGRRSSVIHDVACQDKTRPWRDVHRAFWEGCITDGMCSVRGALYGLSVYCGGPRWEAPAESKVEG